MTTLDYAQLSTDALLQKFIDTAKRTGTVFGLDKKNLLQSVLALHARQNEESVREMQALGAELRRRKPIAKLRLLLRISTPTCEVGLGHNLFRWTTNGRAPP